ncbi:hypothetical protein DPX16_20096 [Anabarilius grahami]|uniref:Secreted protein n=1 Tax=Anabarilius grahami TaxID=495550 RepID=A0A3N0XQM6_ANAGA|nr:hypothetical protein DPX16_20096 [Anabarilius grahami]
MLLLILFWSCLLLPKYTLNSDNVEFINSRDETVIEIVDGQMMHGCTHTQRKVSIHTKTLEHEDEENTLEEHAGGTRWRNTLEEHAGGTRWRNTLEEHAGGTRWRNTLEEHAGDKHQET